MKRIGVNAVLGRVVTFVWVGLPMRAGAATSGPAIPAWAVEVATNLLGPTTSSKYNPQPEVLTVDVLAARVYQSAVSTRDFYGLGHRPIDPGTGDFLDGSGHPTGLNAAHPPGTATAEAVPLTGCGGVNDPNATCHAYGGTANSSYINGNTCYTSPTTCDGCMGETYDSHYAYFCGPGSSRAMASNWYGPPMYNEGEYKPNSTTKGYSYYEHTDWTGGGTYPANMPGPINNDIINHTGYNPQVTSAGSSGSQNGFQNRVGYDVTRADALITELMTDGGGHILPEWSTYGKNVSHFVTIYSYDFTNYNGAINYFDSASPASGTGVVPGRYVQYVSWFWGNVAALDNQVHIP